MTSLGSPSRQNRFVQADLDDIRLCEVCQIIMIASFKRNSLIQMGSKHLGLRRHSDWEF